MRKLALSFVVFVLLLGVGQPLPADTADDFLKAYFFVQEGDAAEKAGSREKAVEKYTSGLKILRKIKAANPDWNPNIIAYRIKYCTEHIAKAGGTVPDENAPVAAEPPPPASPVQAEPLPAPTPVAVPAPTPLEPPVEKTAPEELEPLSVPAEPLSVPEASSSISESIANLERQLAQAKTQIRQLQEEKSDLETRLRKAEDELRQASAPTDDRVDQLLRENHSLKQRLAETEARLRSVPSGSEDIQSLRSELARAEAKLEALQRENQQLRVDNDNLRRDLEESRTELKTTSAGDGSSLSPEALQTLQKENALLRSIVERQFQDDAKRMAARNALARELQELASRAESIRSQIEVLQSPLTPLSDEERRLLRLPAAVVQIQENQPSSDPSRLSGTVTAGRPVNEFASTDSSGQVASASRLTSTQANLARDAKALFAQGDLEGAATKFEAILKQDPENLYALSNLGVVRFRQDRVDEAEKALTKALEIDPQDAFSLSVLGIVHYRQGKFDESIGDLTRALALNPGNHETHNYLGITYSQKGYQEAAEKQLLKAIELKPDYADAHFNLAVVLASENPPSMELARKHYKKAVELGMPKDSELEELLKK